MKTAKMLTIPRLRSGWRACQAICVLAFGLMVFQAGVSEAAPMGTAFTYQGHLYDANHVADGFYDFQFKLFDAASDGNQVGGDVNVPDVDVIDAQFTVELDFGSDVFDGDARWLEIGVRPGELDDPYTVLEPRQEVTPTPYALYAATETDPVFLGSPASGIASSDIINWDTAFGWGDHSTVGYLISETDPTVLASVKDGIDWSEISSRPAGLDDGDDVGITSETDPQVGSNTLNYIPKWNGSELVTGTIYDNGNIGIGMVPSSGKLDVDGNININSVYKISGDTVLSTPDINNTFVGVGAGASNTTGYGNSAMGSEALYKNTTGWENSAMGSAALYNNTGVSNSAMGSAALYSNTEGSFNSAMGYEALYKNTTGSDNSAMGDLALYNNTTGSDNSAMGDVALCHNTTGGYNSAMGSGALYNNTTGGYNSAMGSAALSSNTNGYNNSAMGYEALYSNTIGVGNSAMGADALYKNTTGSGNSAVGDGALYSNTGSWNSAMGYGALYKNTTGSYNSAMGDDALHYNTEGTENTALGSWAGYYNNTGSRNVFIGYQAGYYETGSNKLYIANGPYDSDVLIYGEFDTGRIGIGTVSPSNKLHVISSTTAVAGWFETTKSDGSTNALEAVADADNSGDNRGLYILTKNDGVGKAYSIYSPREGAMMYHNGKVGIGTTVPTYRLELPNIASTDGQGRANAWVTYSSRRWKTNIQPIQDALEKVQRLQGVYFDWKSNGKHDVGLIAEEVGEVIPEVVGYSEDGKNAESLDYPKLVALLIEAVKEQQEKIDAMETALAQNELLRQKVDTLEAKVQTLQPYFAKEVQQ